jgi:hypothetical protein
MAFDLLRRYPVIVAPPLIAMAVVFVLMLLFFGGVVTMLGAGALAGRGAGIAGAVVGGALLLLVLVTLAMLVTLVSSAVVVVMANDALATRAPSLGQAYGAVTTRFTHVMVASLAVSVIVSVASFVFVIPGLIAAFFLMFTLPAVLLDGLGAIDGLKRSATLVKDNLGSVLGLVIGVIVVGVLVAVASMVLSIVPVVGYLASTLLAGAVFAYLTVVAVRVFQTLPRR